MDGCANNEGDAKDGVNGRYLDMFWEEGEGNVIFFGASIGSMEHGGGVVFVSEDFV